MKAGSGADRSVSGTAVAVIVFGLVASGLVYRYWPSDERAIRRHLSNLAEIVANPVSENEAARLTRVAALREYFAPDVQIRVAERLILSRELLVAAIDREAPLGRVVVELADVVVKLAPDHVSAQVTLTVKMASTDPPRGEARVEVRHADLAMAKVEGDWLITVVEERGLPARP